MQSTTYLTTFRTETAMCNRRADCKLLQDVIGENDKYREIFQFATREFEDKNRRIKELSSELVGTYSRIKELEKEIEVSEHRLQEAEAKNHLLNKMLFDKKSEKKKTEIIITAKKKRGARSGHHGHGRKIPDNFPVVEETIEIPEDKRHCSICGKSFIETGMEEISSEICVKVLYYVKVTKCKTYKKTCNCNNPFITAPVPSKLIPKGKFDTSFWVNMLINKYKNHLPVERQIADMKDYGLTISDGTIFGGFRKIHLSYIAPLYKAMANELRKSNHIHADESGWKLFAITDGKSNYRWFIWVFISKDTALFVLAPTRSAKVPYKVLFDIDPDEIEKINNTLINSGAMEPFHGLTRAKLMVPLSSSLRDVIAS